MLSAKLKKLIYIAMFAIFTASTFAATNDLATRFLDKADAAYDDGNLTDAYKYINQALTLNKSDDPDMNVIIFARQIYKQCLTNMKTEYDEQLYIDIVQNLEKFPSVDNTDLQKLVKQVQAIQEQKKEDELAAQRKAQDKMNQDQLNAMREQSASMKEQSEILLSQSEENSRRNEELMNELHKGFEESAVAQKEAAKASQEMAKAQMEAAQASKDALETNRVMVEELKKGNENNQKSTKTILFLIVGIVILILLIVLVITLIARRGFKNQQIQQEQYVQAFRQLAASQNTTNRLMLGNVVDMYGGPGGPGQLKLAGSSRWTPAALPDVEQTPEQQEELRNLAVKCEEIGSRIDQVTGRKNNSKNVSEMVYKIAIQLGLPQGESMLYFCAAMIYDAGFLELPEELLSAEQLTPEQRKEMQNHVNLAENRLDFVPKKYWEVFDGASRCHHENMDGSGYPKGLKGDKIPQIARLIRVCESFISMSSKRDYREIMDKETALEKLREQPQFYDPDVVDILEQII